MNITKCFLGIMAIFSLNMLPVKGDFADGVISGIVADQTVGRVLEDVKLPEWLVVIIGTVTLAVIIFGICVDPIGMLGVVIGATASNSFRKNKW